MTRSKSILLVLFILTLGSCVPLSQQLAESEARELEGFIGPLVISKKEFERIIASSERLSALYNGKTMPVSSHGNFRDPKIIQHKLVVHHTYGGGASNRESSKLYWRGDYHQKRNGDYIADVILHSDVCDIRRALIHDRKVIAIDSLQRPDTNTIWINLVGYEQLIKYEYSSPAPSK